MSATSSFRHITVLLEEAVEGLALREDGCYLDGTFGRGGHSRLILERLGHGGRLLGFDKDPQAIATGQALAADDGRFVIVQRSFAELGARVALSPPAVHERVRRLKQAGIIRDTIARIDGAAVGKPLTAFVHVEAAGWGKSDRLLALQCYPEVEEMHSVAGDASMVLKVRTADPQALEHLLGQIHSISGVKGTKTFIVLVGSGRRRKLGRYPFLTLSKAREKATALLTELASGVQPLKLSVEKLH